MVSRPRQIGVTYLWMLFLVFLLGLGLGKSLEVYSTALQREKERELLYVGSLYRSAIRQFYLSSPGAEKKYPESLESLLRDPRYLPIRRYLRQLYRDPVTGAEFVPVAAPAGGIWGVRSSSSARPFKRSGFQEFDAFFAQAQTYAQWEFSYKEGL